MKKTNLFGMLALSCALVFGMVSCKNETAPATRSAEDVLLDTEVDLTGRWNMTDVLWDDEYNEPGVSTVDGDIPAAFNGTGTKNTRTKEDYMKVRWERFNTTTSAKSYISSQLASLKAQKTYIENSKGTTQYSGIKITDATFDYSIEFNEDATVFTVTTTTSITQEYAGITWTVTTETMEEYSKEA